jgi:SEC-C motif-containing protein
MTSIPCPCTSGKPYHNCCGPYHEHRASAKTVKQFMRSRYCAYALGGLGEYLLETWHPSSHGSLTAASLSAKTLDWQSLKILDFSQKGDEGMVKFEARYLNDDGSPGLLQEASRFLRVSGKWLYLDGNQVTGNNIFDLSF